MAGPEGDLKQYIFTDLKQYIFTDLKQYIYTDLKQYPQRRIHSRDKVVLCHMYSICFTLFIMYGIQLTANRPTLLIDLFS